MEDRKKEILRALETEGRFEGYKKVLVRRNSSRFPWEIIHTSDLFGTNSELYSSLEDAIYDFIELEKVVMPSVW